MNIYSIIRFPGTVLLMFTYAVWYIVKLLVTNPSPPEIKKGQTRAVQCVYDDFDRLNTVAHTSCRCEIVRLESVVDDLQDALMQLKYDNHQSALEIVRLEKIIETQSEENKTLLIKNQYFLEVVNNLNQNLLFKGLGTDNNADPQ